MRLSQPLPQTTKTTSATANRASLPLQPGPAPEINPKLRGGIQKGDLKPFDALVAPFVTVTPKRIQKIIPHDANKSEDERLLQHDQKTGRIVVKLDSQEKILAMHNKVVRNQDMLDRFIKKEGLLKRIGERVVGFFRNIGSAVGLTQNELAAHMSADVATNKAGHTKLLVRTHKTEQLTGNPEGEGAMRLRHKQGVLAGLFRSLWAGSASPIKGMVWIHHKLWSGANFEAEWGKWKYDHTNDGVYQKRLDQMRNAAQAMAMQMAFLPTADTSEIDEIFDTHVEADAKFLKETNFLAAIKEHIETPNNQYATSAGHQAVEAAQKCIDEDLPLSHLQSTQHLVILRQIFKEIFVKEDDKDKALKDKQAFEQTDGAVYELGKEYRQAYQDLQNTAAKMNQVGQQVEASKSHGDFVAGQVAMQTAPVLAQLVKVRDQQAQHALKLGTEILDKDGMYARMRQGKALVRGMLPIAMKHDAKALRQFVQNELNEAGYSNHFTRNVWDVTGSYKFSQDAAQAIYEGIIKGVSEPLIKSLAMNEADAMKSDAKQFVDTFESEVFAKQNSTWEQGGRDIATGLIGAEGLFRAQDKAQAQQEAAKQKHEDIGQFIIGKRVELQQKGGEDQLSLSQAVIKTLHAQLDQLDAENKAVAKSTDHVFEVLKPAGRLQQAVTRTEQAMLDVVKSRDMLSAYSLREASLTKLETEFNKDLDALRADLRKIEGELTSEHAQVLDSALRKTEKRISTAIADLQALRQAAATAATSTDEDELHTAQARMTALASRMKGPDANGQALSLDGVLPSEASDAPFKAGVHRLAERIQQVLGDASKYCEAYDRRRNEISASLDKAPDDANASPVAGIFGKIDTVSQARDATLTIEADHRQLIEGCAALSGEAAKKLGSEYRLNASQLAEQQQRTMVTNALGLSLNANPPPSTRAIDAWISLRDESAFAVLRDNFHQDVTLNESQRNTLFNTLCGNLRPGQDNDVADIQRIAQTLFSGAAKLPQALALSRHFLSVAGRTALDRRTHLSALDPVLDKVRDNKAVKFMLEHLVPEANLSNAQGLLDALAKAEVKSKEVGAADTSAENMFAVHQAFDRLSEAYRLLNTQPAPGQTHSVDDEQRFSQLQRVAAALASMPENPQEMARHQARLALADLMTQVSGDPLAIESLRDDKAAQTVRDKVKAAVSLEGLARDPGYDGIGQQMASMAERMNAYAKAGNAASVDSLKPLRALQNMMSPEDFQAFEARIKTDPHYADSVLYYGVLMTFVDSIDNSDIGANHHLKLGANPADNPLLYLSPTRYSLKQPLDFSAFRQRAWSPQQLAQAREQLQQVEKFLQTGEGLKDKQELRELLADRMMFANTLSDKERRTIKGKLLNNSVLTPDERKSVRQVSNIDKLDQALLHASRERTARFEDDMAQALNLAPDYRFFDPRTLSFDQVAQRHHDELQRDNPFHYGTFKQLIGQKDARIGELKTKLGLNDKGLTALNRRANESTMNIISRLGAMKLRDSFTTATEQGLQLFQAMKNLKMADVYASARMEDAGQFAELSAARERYLDQTHALARQQMLRAGILMAWESTGQSFEAFANDKKAVTAVQQLLQDWGFGELKTSSRESTNIGELIRQELESAKADVGKTTTQWAAQAGEFRSQLRKYQNEFEAAVQVILTELKAAQAQRANVLADAGERARDAVFAMRAQTARAIDAAQLKPNGTVLVQAREITRLRLQTLVDQAQKEKNNSAASAITKLMEEIDQRVAYQEGDTWEDLSDRAAMCLRDGMAQLERRGNQPAADAAMSTAVERLGVTGAVMQAVQDALNAEPELQAQALYNSASIQFEADFRRDLPALRQQAADTRAQPESPPIQLLRARAMDELPALFGQQASSTINLDLGSQGLPEATLMLIGRLQNIAENDKLTDTQRTDARALVSVLVPLKRVGDIARTIGRTPVSESNRPAIATLQRELTEALAELKQASESKAVAGIKPRQKNILRNLTPEQATLEFVRANLTASRSAGVAPVLDFHTRITDEAAKIGQPSADEGFDGEVALDDGAVDFNAAVADEALRNEVLGFEAYVQDIANVFPEHRGTCEKLLNDAGGGMALYQLRSALYSARLTQDDSSKDAVQDTLNRFAALYALEPAAGVLRDTEFGLQVKPRLTDGEVATQAKLLTKTADSSSLLNGNAYFEAIAQQTGEDQSSVRRRILGEMEKFAADTSKLPAGIAQHPTKAQQNAMSLDARLHGAPAWGDDMHAPYVARVFKRPVVLIAADRALLFETDKPVRSIASGVKLPDNAIHLVNAGGNRWLAATKVAQKAQAQGKPVAQAKATINPQAAQAQPLAPAQTNPVKVSTATTMPVTGFKNVGNTCYLNATLKTMLSSMGPEALSKRLHDQRGSKLFDLTVGNVKPLDEIRVNLINLALVVNDSSPQAQVDVERRLTRFVNQLNDNNGRLNTLANQARTDLEALSSALKKTEDPLSQASSDLELAQVALRLVQDKKSPTQVLSSLSGNSSKAKVFTTATQLTAFIADKQKLVQKLKIAHDTNRNALNDKARKQGYASFAEQRQTLNTVSVVDKFAGKVNNQQDASEFGGWLRDVMNLTLPNERFTVRLQHENVWNETRRLADEQHWSLALNPTHSSDSLQALIDKKLKQTEVISSNPDGGSATQSTVIEADLGVLTRFAVNLDGFNNDDQRVRLDKVDFNAELTVPMWDARDGKSKQVVLRPREVVFHQGEDNAGHYTAYIRHQAQWYLHDDAKAITQQPLPDLKTAQPRSITFEVVRIDSAAVQPSSAASV